MGDIKKKKKEFTLLAFQRCPVSNHSMNQLGATTLKKQREKHKMHSKFKEPY